MVQRLLVSRFSSNVSATFSGKSRRHRFAFTHLREMRVIACLLIVSNILISGNSLAFLMVMLKLSDKLFRTLSDRAVLEKKARHQLFGTPAFKSSCASLSNAHYSSIRDSYSGIVRL
ncbi:hypothetical protein YC2023_045833 [Brassica napus]